MEEEEEEVRVWREVGWVLMTLRQLATLVGVRSYMEEEEEGRWEGSREEGKEGGW